VSCAVCSVFGQDACVGCAALMTSEGGAACTASMGACTDLVWCGMLVVRSRRWVWETVRGIDNDPVTPKSLLKSVISCKSFGSTSDAAVIARWLHVLSGELAERLAEEEDEHSRRPRTLGGCVGERAPCVRGALPRHTRMACGRPPPCCRLATLSSLCCGRAAPCPSPHSAAVPHERQHKGGPQRAWAAARRRQRTRQPQR
jgi:hypothetical protein